MRELLGRAGLLNQERFAALYEQHADAAQRLAFLLAGDDALAQDLVQEAFVRVSTRLVHIRNPDAFEPYLRRTIVNLANSHWRRMRRERRHADFLPAPTAIASAEVRVADRDRMRRALMGLPPRQRAALVLRFYEDLSEESTADLLGCPRGTVKTLVARGLKAMRKEISNE